MKLVTHKGGFIFQSARVNNTKRKIVSEEDSEEDVPISQRKKKKTEKKTKKAKKRSRKYSFCSYLILIVYQEKNIM